MGEEKIIVNKIQMNCTDKIEQIMLPHDIEIPEEWQVNEKTMMFYIIRKLCGEGNKCENKIQKTTSK